MHDLFAKGKLLPETLAGDALDTLNAINASGKKFDVLFLDPPFNIDKTYPSNYEDKKPFEEYLEYLREVIQVGATLLKPGGVCFSWNIPLNNHHLFAHLIDAGLTLRSSVAVKFTTRLPIRGKLYPANYSLLYFCKGSKPSVFTPDRLPLEKCRHCGKDIKDYGGHRKKLNSSGISLSDVWTDIHPVRHAAKKSRKTGINELPLTLTYRCLKMSTVPGSTIIDPFCGSGSTLVTGAYLGCHTTGIDIDIGDVNYRVKHRADNDYAELSRIASSLNTLD